MNQSVPSELIRELDQRYSEADLKRITDALRIMQCDMSETLLREIIDVLHTSCARGWSGDPLVYPSWLMRT